MKAFLNRNETADPDKSSLLTIDFCPAAKSTSQITDQVAEDRLVVLAIAVFENEGGLIRKDAQP